MMKEVTAVLNYLERVNRPCSINDICGNLQNEFSKNTILKVLDELKVDKIREKIYNKQKIYSIIQQPSANSGDVESALKEYELEIMMKAEQLKNLKTELRTAENELTRYNSSLTMKAAVEKKQELLASVEILKTKLSNLTENSIPMSDEDRIKIEKDYETVVKTYKSRKRICTDILNSIAENYPKPKSSLIEDIELELDDEENTPSLPK